MRTQDLTNTANSANISLRDAFSLYMWGSATFDVTMRFLHECTWVSIEKLKEKVPEVLFKMMLRGVNAMEYTNYINNVVKKFCKQASKSSLDIFLIFNCLNYIDDLKLGTDAAGSALGFLGVTLSYKGVVLDPNKGNNYLKYYIKMTRDLSNMGVHYLSIKYMKGFLTPRPPPFWHQC